MTGKIQSAPGLARARQSLYGAPANGDFAVNRSACPSRWAILVVAIAALTLAGCGRKGGLDLPPGAATLPEPTVVEAEPAKGSVFDPSYGTNAPPTASKGQKKSFILDPLLNN
jgi:predicted small lipoprotein YifL